MKIYYQGEPGAFSEAAVLSYFPSATPEGFASFDTVFAHIGKQAGRVGLLPIENAYRGTVYDVLDLLTQSRLTIWAEVVQPVNLALIGLPGQSMEDIRKVRSHPQALMQSRGFWKAKGWDAEASLDTAGSVRELRDHQWPDVAAIASPRAAEIYGMKILEVPIEDHSDNRTRFWLLSETEPVVPDLPWSGYKSSVVFDLPEHPGSLYETLRVISGEYGLNLTKIESRPQPGKPFAFRFLVDIEGDVGVVGEAIAKVARQWEWFRVLGQYPVIR